MPHETNRFYTSMGRPHVVILGAGASLATFPNGGKIGKKLPLMTDFIDIVGLSSILDRYSIDYKDRNFEEIYSDLYGKSSCKELVKNIDTAVWNYFSRLGLPAYPTLYDHLVLSLRNKDLIATFNWDPLLYQACWRNHKHSKLPHVVYLHGNVAVGYCETDNTKGRINSKCSKCGGKFIPSRLLYPIKQKGYTQDKFTRYEWETLKSALSSAYVLTVFGYSAPQSDIEAIELMKGAWGNKYQRNLEQIEIIDTKSEQELSDTWKDFIHTHHYNTSNDFYKSLMGLFPRRTCEAEWNYTMPAKPIFFPHNPIPKNLGFKELWEWYSPLIEAENKKAQT